jgi:hypothetical protein
MGVSPCRVVRATGPHTATIAVRYCPALRPVGESLISSKCNDDSMHRSNHGTKHWIAEQSGLISVADWESL